MIWRRAVVLGASGGIGAALVDRLRADGTEVAPLSRPAIDLPDEAGLADFVVRNGGEPVDLVIVASGILAAAGRGPEKSMRDVDPHAVAEVLAVNAVGPLIAAKHLVPLLPRSGRSAFAVLGARVGSITDNRLGGWYGYRASKAALAMIVRTLAIEVARSRPDAVVCALHPGTVATRLSRDFVQSTPADRVFTPEIAAAHLLNVVSGLSPADSGGHYGWDGALIEP